MSDEHEPPQAELPIIMSNGMIQFFIVDGPHLYDYWQNTTLEQQEADEPVIVSAHTPSSL